jgi:hypothetical protein
MASTKILLGGALVGSLDEQNDWPTQMLDVNVLSVGSGCFIDVYGGCSSLEKKLNVAAAAADRVKSLRVFLR